MHKINRIINKTFDVMIDGAISLYNSHGLPEGADPRR